MFRLIYLGLLLLTGLTFGGCLSDLRTEIVEKEDMEVQQVEKGRRLLQEMAAAHGWDAYRSFESARVVFRDEWGGGVKQMAAMPWKKNAELMELSYLIGTADSRLTFLEGKQEGEVWGIQHWATYTEEAGGTAQFKQQKKLKFWLPTIQYFMEMPFAIQSAALVQYAGETSVNDTTYDLVFCSWGQTAPQKKIDQYLLWINQETKLLDYAQYSIRDLAGFLKGAMHFEDYRTIGGVQVSFKQTASSMPGDKKYLHRYLLDSCTFNDITNQAIFYPRPDFKLEK